MHGAQMVTRKGLRVLYDCESICQVTAEQPDGDMLVRAASRCSLPGFDHARWTTHAHPRAAAEAERLAGDIVGQASRSGIPLDFDLDRDGCPLGWATSHFGASVMRYSGHREYDSPMRNMPARMHWRLRSPDDENMPRLLDRIEWGEGCENSCYAWFREVLNR